MIRVVVEIPQQPGVRTEKEAVWWLRHLLEDAGLPSMASRVKSYSRVRTGESLKLDEGDIVKRLRRLRNELNTIIGDAT